MLKKHFPEFKFAHARRGDIASAASCWDSMSWANILAQMLDKPNIMEPLASIILIADIELAGGRPQEALSANAETMNLLMAAKAEMDSPLDVDDERWRR